MGCEIEQFFYKPTNSIALYPTFLGIGVEGSRGRYNQFGTQTEIVKTIPIGLDSYVFSVADPDIIRLTNPGTQFKVAFVNRATLQMNPSLITFNNPYLFVINIYSSS